MRHHVQVIGRCQSKLAVHQDDLTLMTSVLSDGRVTIDCFSTDLLVVLNDASTLILPTHKAFVSVPIGGAQE